MIDSKYPTLDLLELHGLRAAYVILLHGTRSWNHFQTLHDYHLPETCRLPRTQLLALKGESRRLMGVRSGGLATKNNDLLAEFDRARGDRDLSAFHWALLRARLGMPEERTPASPHDVSWQDSVPFRNVVPGREGAFRGTWRGVNVQVRVVLANSVGSQNDANYATIEAVRNFDKLSIDIRIEGTMAFARSVRAIESMPRHPSMIDMGWDRTLARSWFHYELGSDGLGKYLVAMDDLHRQVAPTDPGFARLTKMLAHIGVTNLHAE